MKIYNEYGKLFYFPIRFFGYMIIVFSVFSVFSVSSVSSVLQIIQYILISFFGILLSRTSYGSEIDMTNKKIREITKCFFFRFGEWISFSEFDYISIQKKSTKMNVYFASTYFFTEKKEIFEILITDVSLKTKAIISQKKTLVEAEEFADNYSYKLNIPFKNYSKIIIERKLNLFK